LLAHEPLIWPLPCRKINGVGPKTAARLAALGIETIGQLAACERDWLVEQFGASHGAWLFDAAWGRDDRPVVTESEPVSISRETTFERDLHAVRDREALGAIFTRLCEQVAEDLVRKGYAGRTIGVKLRYADFRRVTRETTLEHATADAAQIRRVAGLCLKRLDLTQRFRLLGVRVGSLQPLTAASAPGAGRISETIRPDPSVNRSDTAPKTEAITPSLF
jgi:DNA polymerase-4